MNHMTKMLIKSEILRHAFFRTRPLIVLIAVSSKKERSIYDSDVLKFILLSNNYTSIPSLNYTEVTFNINILDK